MLIPVAGLQLFAEQIQEKNPLTTPDWYFTEWSNVTVVSNANRKKTEAIANGVAEFLENIESILPYPTRGDMWPLRIYVCRDPRTFVELAPPESKYEKNVSGFFTQGLGYDVIVVLADAPKSQLRSVIFHELVHREMRSQGEIPLWLDEGIAEVFSNFKFSDHELLYALSDSEHRHWIQRRGPLSLARMFHVNHSSPEYNEQNLTSAFYSTAWAFTHYGLFGENGSLRSKFLEFVEASRKQIVSESLFRQYFGKTYAQMQDQLVRYCRGFSFPKGKMQSNNNPSEQHFQWTQNEPNQARLLLIGASTLSRKFDQSHKLFEAFSVDEGIKNESIRNLERIEHATLAYYEQEFEHAHRYAERAYNDGDKTPTTLLIFAESLLNVTPGSRIYYDDLVPLKLVNKAFDCINHVLEYAPRNPLACRLYAVGWLRTTAEPSYAQYDKLMNHVRTQGGDAEIAFLTADLMSLHKKYDKARTILLQFKEQTSSPSAREECIKRLQNLPSPVSGKTR